ncbi:hypothetical protein EG68_05191 [Paragonimus skrjabini miyazakii]|uniref:Uncharacterized protein n=1 Tax=Paragonimus skrjabini miyazakii TaxID=59628 RepID=A0A8S9YS24_9TREM|nr:hypothetical protein EG68_05191 [Paragonimus skrjabini miyazakii]
MDGLLGHVYVADKILVPNLEMSVAFVWEVFGAGNHRLLLAAPDVPRITALFVFCSELHDLHTPLFGCCCQLTSGQNMTQRISLEQATQQLKPTPCGCLKQQFLPDVHEVIYGREVNQIPVYPLRC